MMGLAVKPGRKPRAKVGGQPKIRDAAPARVPAMPRPVVEYAASKTVSAMRALWQGVPAPRAVHYPLSNEEVRAVQRDHSLHRWLIAQYQAGRRDLEPTLLQVNAGLMEVVAQRYDAKRYGDWLDVRQEAKLGLLEGCARFDLTLDVSPSTYLVYWIRTFVRRFVQREGSVVMIPQREYNLGRCSFSRRYVYNFSELPDQSNEDVERAFEESLVDPSDIADEALHEEELRAAYKPLADYLVRDLSPREHDILRRRYVTDHPETFDDIGRSMDLSRERIRQLEVGALAKCANASTRLGSNPGTFRTFEEWVLSATYALALLRQTSMWVDVSKNDSLDLLETR
jgi:RNA polymerase sigma-32 factor